MEFEARIMDMRHIFPAGETAEASALPGFAALVAVIAASQASGQTAQVAARLARSRPLPPVPVPALTVLFDGRGDRDWRLGALALRGSFHPIVAATLPGKEL